MDDLRWGLSFDGVHIWRKVCFASSQKNQITKNDWTPLVGMDQHGPEGRRDGLMMGFRVLCDKKGIIALLIQDL